MSNFRLADVSLVHALDRMDSKDDPAKYHVVTPLPLSAFAPRQPMKIGFPKLTDNTIISAAEKDARRHW
jgi:hypothetical protein